jgi:sulfur carrier protein ThiS
MKTNRTQPETRIYLGGFFTFYLPGLNKDQHWVIVELAEPSPLRQVLLDLGIPPAEVNLVAVNGEAVDPSAAVIHPGDEVRLYPPIGGGSFSCPP